MISTFGEYPNSKVSFLRLTNRKKTIADKIENWFFISVNKNGFQFWQNR